MKALGDEQAAEEEKRRQAEVADMKRMTRIEVFFLSGEIAGVRFDDHAGCYQPDEIKVVPAVVLNIFL